MPSNVEHDFLSNPPQTILRKEMQNICDSYNHSWDLLAEICQNSVDAIKLHKNRYGSIKKHEIKITINKQNRSITIRDTGIGIKPDKVAELMGPHSTDKCAEDQVVGEKGVGLTYTIFISNLYKIKTNSIEGFFEGEVRNARIWKEGSIDEIPKLIQSSFSLMVNTPNDTYTEIYIADIDTKFEESDEIFNQSPEVLEFILRTKTAIGSTVRIFNPEATNSINVSLTCISEKGERKTFKIEPYYMLPEEYISHKKDVIKLSEFKEKAAVLSDAQKEKLLYKKCMTNAGVIERGTRKIKYYAFFTHSRHVWDTISNMANLITDNGVDEETHLYSYGIYISTKGMPTGIRLEPKFKGEAAYWPNFYILLEDDSIIFDLGRKTIPEPTKKLFQKICNDIFNSFIKYKPYMSSEPSIDTPISAVIEHEKNTFFQELGKSNNLNCDSINYLKHPSTQEAGVSAIFHELVGAKILKGYYTLRSGYKMAYDLWGKYKIPLDLIGSNYANLRAQRGILDVDIIIEFKYFAADIIDDLEDNKFFRDIDLIVCWDLNEEKLQKNIIQVDILNRNEVFYYGSNYMLTWPASKGLGDLGKKPVLSLRTLLDDLKRGKIETNI